MSNGKQPGLRPKVMMVTKRMQSPAVGGRAQLSRLHHDCLQDLFGEDLIFHALDPVTGQDARARARMLGGWIDGVTPKSEEVLLARAAAEAVTHVYLDGSNLGTLAPAIKKSLPRVKIFTFFHNVEARFFLGALRQTRSIHALGVLLANYLAERRAVRWSDHLITLSARDSGHLERLYGRGATDILPMAIRDKLQESGLVAERAGTEEYALFVGGAFYANQAGIQWFAKAVAPYISLKTCVVGQGMEGLQKTIGASGKVEVIGAVDRLDQWYLDALVVIAPIFDGSGMKTKTAEALMFGKKIIGTSEAFSGYEQVASQTGWLCDTAEEFIAVLNRLHLMSLPRFDADLRRLYESLYSPAATREGLQRIFCGGQSTRWSRSAKDSDQGDLTPFLQ